MNTPTAEPPDLINLMEWNRFAEDRKTLLEALTILNNRHRTIVAELNQCIIDRAESHTVQIIRIEDTWREKLRESQAQAAELREALIPFYLFARGFRNRDDILTPVVEIGRQSLIVGAFLQALEVMDKIEGNAACSACPSTFPHPPHDSCSGVQREGEALSSPPPLCVPLAEAQSLADALQSLRDEQNGPPLERHKIHWQEAYDTATRLLNEWDAKHPQPQTA